MYWILFPINDLRQAVETSRRILTKEKLNILLTGQSSSTLFMSIRDGHRRRVSFDTKEELGDKIDKLAVMIGRLTTRDSGINRDFKPQIPQSRGRGQNRQYNQEHYKDRYRSNNRSNSRDRGQYRQDKSRPRYEHNYRRGNFRGNMRNYGRQNSRGECINNYRNDSYDRSRDGSRERFFPEIMAITELEVQAIVGPGQDAELAQIGVEFIVISVGNMIISGGTVPLLDKKRR